MAGLTDKGLEILRLPEVVSQLNNNATLLFQDLVPEGDVVNTDTNSLLGRLIGLVSPAYTDLWEGTQEDYNAFNINAATGVSLDNLMMLGGVTRKGATATSGYVLVKGALNTTINYNSSVKSGTTGKSFTLTDTTVLTPLAASGISINLTTVADNTDYIITFVKSSGGTSNVVTVNSGANATKAIIYQKIITAISNSFLSVLTTPVVQGDYLYLESADVFVRIDFSVSTNISIVKVGKLSFAVCDETGVIEQAANTITTIATPILGWDSVTNPATMTTGTDKEDDATARANYIARKSINGNSSYEAVYSGVEAVAGVSGVQLYENATDFTLTTPNPPLPPHSFLCIVQGGGSNDIAVAVAIGKNKPAGIQAYGDITVNVTDSRGVQYPVSFSRPTVRDIFINLNITTQDNFDAGGIATIKNNLVSYFNTLKTGDDVIYSRLFTPINQVSGFYINSLTIGTTSNPNQTTNIAMQFYELATLNINNITISQS